MGDRWRVRWWWFGWYDINWLHSLGLFWLYCMIFLLWSAHRRRLFWNPRAIKNRYVCKPVMVCICVGFCVGSRCIDAKEGPQWTRKKEREPAIVHVGTESKKVREAGLVYLWSLFKGQKDTRPYGHIMYNIEGQKVRGHYKLIYHLKYRTNIQCIRGITVPHQL